MLNFSLNLTWDTGVNRWMVIDTDFGEKAGEANDVVEIHGVNMAMSQILKIFEVLDTPVAAQSITIVPGVTANVI